MELSVWFGRIIRSMSRCESSPTLAGGFVIAPTRRPPFQRQQALFLEYHTLQYHRIALFQSFSVLLEVAHSELLFTQT
jgi:hypothetical protein